ncbi:MAG: methyl-accepting chemotaxis protein [Candidatus Thiodiazotropha sp. (ex Dulcina madagascariensis)]|nr:methyl-accepting chemotaxis protein [Candidatus Thiodiazotropha sp. (ex Dulcina madagascariensis)]MCU7927182.1 methyl-accepting chemotaxis protein [Candidatus Thiodiazotropha sp. (ex Dulcina madagascariensis)]
MEKRPLPLRSLVEEVSILDKGNADFYREMQITFENYYQTGKEMAARYVAEGPSGGNPFMETFDRAAASMSVKLDRVLQQATTNASKRMNEINQNIEGIRVVSEQTATAAQQTSDASDSLSEQAVSLHRFVGRFKV